MHHRMMIILASVGMMAAAPLRAAPDLDRLAKDTRIMSSIVTGAFDSDRDCEYCSVGIEGKYLAHQGAVFLIQTHAYRMNMPDALWFDTRGLEDVKIFSGMDFGGPRTEVIRKIVRDVDVDEEHEVFVHDMAVGPDENTMEALLDKRRARRDVQEQLRGMEIEVIHSEPERRKALEHAIGDLREKLEAMRTEEAQIEQDFRSRRSQRLEARKTQQAAHEQELEQQIQALRVIVLQAFCDYGATLKNLPRDQWVSLVFKGKEQDRIMVFDRDEITTCKGNLQGKGTSYLF